MNGIKLIEHIEKRWSPYDFTEKEIDKNTLTNILDAARQAPSSYNEQPWRFIVGVKGDKVYDKILSVLVEQNREWARHVPVLILTAASANMAKTGKPNPYSMYDLGQSAAFMILQAMEHNVYAHQMGGFSKEKAAEVFGLGTEHAPGSVIALGYIENGSAAKERVRKPLSEVVHSHALELKESTFTAVKV